MPGRGQYQKPEHLAAHQTALRLARRQRPAGSDYLSIARALKASGLPRELRMKIAAQACRMVRG